ncbi:MAG TPA: glycosyltransferase family 4 protein [Actinomycetota bacterium]|nr:glycosyltransferase family 4 protein [Actinomycetota bacterium]
MLIALVDPGAYTPPYDDRLASSLAARGHRVHLLTAPFRFGETPRADRYRREELFFRLSSSLFRRTPRSRWRLPLKAIEYIPGTNRLRRRIDELDPDVVHFQWLVHRPDIDLRWLRAIAAQRRTVFTAHDLWAMLESREGEWRRVFETVDRVIVHSRRGVDELSRLGLAKERIARIPHAVFDSDQIPDPAPPVGSTLLVFGVIRTYKGIDVLLRALPEIARRVPEARLIVAGDPQDPVEPFLALADHLGIAGLVEWRPRFQSEGEIDTLMTEATVVVLPYRHQVDSSGVLARALGRGRPVVATSVGNLGETVEEFGAGEVVPPEDVGALATACIRLLTDAGARERAIRGALAARRTLTWQVSAQLHEQLYAGLSEPGVPNP